MSERKLDEIELKMFMCVDSGTISDEAIEACKKEMEQAVLKHLGVYKKVFSHVYRETQN